MIPQSQNCCYCHGNHHRWTAHTVQRLSCESSVGRQPYKDQGWGEAHICPDIPPVLHSGLKSQAALFRLDRNSQGHMTRYRKEDSGSFYTWWGRQIHRLCKLCPLSKKVLLEWGEWRWRLRERIRDSKLFTAVHTIVIKIVLCTKKLPITPAALVIKIVFCTKKLPITPAALVNYSTKYNNCFCVSSLSKLHLQC